jgi:hypothetical protein
VRLRDTWRLPGEATIGQGPTGQPRVIEEKLVPAGFAPREPGTMTVMNKWPDASHPGGRVRPVLPGPAGGDRASARPDAKIGSLRSSAGSPPNSALLTRYPDALAGQARPFIPTPDVLGQPLPFDHRM